eukprot:jgi/Antlo1/1643/722
MSVKKEAKPRMHTDAGKDAETKQTCRDVGVENAVDADAQCATQDPSADGMDKDESNNSSSSEDKNISEEMQQVEELIREEEERTETSSVDDSEEDVEDEEGSAECSSSSGSNDVEAEDDKAGSRDTRKEDDDGLSVFIKGFGCEITESALRNEMSKYGTVKGVRMPKDRKTGKPKGFAYVDFGEKKAVQKVLKLKSIMGLEVVVDKPRPMIRREKLVTVFVKNLPYECTENAIKEYFGKFGEIHNVRMPRDDNKRVKGFAFVEVVGRDGYEKILKSTHVFEDRKLLVSECLKGGRGRSNDGGRGNDDSRRHFDSEGPTKRFKRNAREEESEDNDSSEEQQEKRCSARREDRRDARKSSRDKQDSDSSEFENAGKNRQERDHNRGDRRNNKLDRKGNDFHKKTAKNAKSSRNNKIVFDSDSD